MQPRFAARSTRAPEVLARGCARAQDLDLAVLRRCVPTAREERAVAARAHRARPSAGACDQWTPVRPAKTACHSSDRLPGMSAGPYARQVKAGVDVGGGPVLLDRFHGGGCDWSHESHQHRHRRVRSAWSRPPSRVRAGPVGERARYTPRFSRPLDSDSAGLGTAIQPPLKLPSCRWSLCLLSRSPAEWHFCGCIRFRKERSREADRASSMHSWHTNRMSRLVKRPKLHVGDTGVRMRLARDRCRWARCRPAVAGLDAGDLRAARAPTTGELAA